MIVSRRHMLDIHKEGFIVPLGSSRYPRYNITSDSHKLRD